MTSAFFQGEVCTGLDERWVKVDQWSWSQTHNSTSVPTQETIDKALKYQADSGLPDIAVSPARGKFLYLQAKLSKMLTTFLTLTSIRKNILEVGTLSGVSTIFFATTSPTTKITTIEINPQHASVARHNLATANVSNRVEIILGEGIDVKGYYSYYMISSSLTRPKGLIIVDDVVRRGNLVDEGTARSNVNIEGARRVNSNAGRDGRVESVVMQMVGEKNYDGMLYAVVKG
ncbi:O-methyltransferas-like protein family 3 [Tothia fuscella]|uniref:O-methyltransferas-like protein family 3 n=1 Tax=Tothia fuscella TaxID=1048955 RepID=A0A9P4U110_9PEZI|nr:O-methyltransferas-like protein family 3 [Tothia fuscella]